MGNTRKGNGSNTHRTTRKANAYKASLQRRASALGKRPGRSAAIQLAKVERLLKGNS